MAADKEKLRQTVLHDRHVALGANMAPFAGWEMPLWYREGAVKEHLAVVQHAGIFDTSHMDVLLMTGETVRDFLNYAFTRDIADLRLGRAGYGAFLNLSGHCIDDGIVYPLAEDRFAVVVNAGMGPTIAGHLAGLPGAENVEICEPAKRLAKIDVQGPACIEVLRPLLANAEEVLTGFPYFSFKGDFDLARSGVTLAGAPVFLSRTGYTGELGFEIFLSTGRAGKVWDKLLAAGQQHGLLPCGLAARDSLRTGAVLPLSHQDIGPWPFINHPWPFALPYRSDGAQGFGKAFFGCEALDAVHNPYTLPFVGYDPRRVEPAAAKVYLEGREVGKVLTIVSDMAIGWLEGKVVNVNSPDLPDGWRPRGLACGFVKVDPRLEPGCELMLRDDRREIKVEVAADIRPHRGARKKIVIHPHS